MSRLAYQRQWAIGKVVNLGAGDDPANFGAGATNVDIDIWDLPNFVPADITNLPFGDKEFDTAVLGDVLEHCLLPELAASEAARVARRVVMTIPEEMALPSVGQHIELGIKARADHYRAEHGRLVEGMSDDDVIIFHKRTDSRFVSAVPESHLAHDGHINRFDEAWVDRIVLATGMRVIDRQKIAELHWMNWLITVEDKS